MRSEHMADFFEEMNRFLSGQHLGWLTDKDGPKGIHKSKEIQNAVKEFVLYCIEENIKSMSTPRGRNGKSYLDYRQEAMERAEKEVFNEKIADSAR